MTPKEQQRIDGVFDSMVEVFGRYTVAAMERRFYELEPQCQSPIEREMLARLVICEVPYNLPASEHYTTPPVIYPQHAVLGYRLDFAVIGGGHGYKIAIECDGHDFHERAKEQAAHDRQRDRRLTTAGWTVLRFTGHEIYSKPSRILDALCEYAERVGKAEGAA